MPLVRLERGKKTQGHRLTIFFLFLGGPIEAL